MRALSFARFGGPEVLEIIEAPAPVPGPAEVRIAVRACGVNPFDWKQRRGLFGGVPPIRVGVEVAGVVDAIGEGARDVTVGDRIYGFSIGGGAADLTLSSAWAPIPAGLDFATAAGMPVALETSYRVLDLFDSIAGTRILINGASGGVGQAMTQIATARGARVIGVASAANLPLLEGLGAEPVTYGPGLVERVRGLGSAQIDLAVDAGGGGTLPVLVELVGDPDRVVTIVPDASAAELGVRVSGGNSAFHGLTDIASLLESGQYVPPRIVTFALESAELAFARSETGHPGASKLVITL